MIKVTEKFPYFLIKTAENLPLFNIWSTDRMLIDPVKMPILHNANPHVHTNIEISFVAYGEGTLYVDNIGYPLCKGDLIFIKSLESHYVVPVSYEEPLGIIDIIFTPINASKFVGEFFSSDLVREMYQTGGNCILPRDNENIIEIGKLMCEMEAEFLREDVNIYLAKAKFMTVLARLSDFFADSMKPAKVSEKSSVIINGILKFINENITKDINLNILANEAKMDVSHFSAVFKSIHGISPWSYVVNERISLSLKYLNHENNDYTIREIATLSSFKNFSNFNRIFKKKMGMTPSDFKKQRKNT